jgi:hypothetical protein
MTPTQQKIKDIRQMCSDSLDLSGIRKIYELLAEADMAYHPDDDVTDIKWDHELGYADIERMTWIDNSLIEATSRLGLDIYEESMQGHVRALGDKSCFYPEHRDYADRKWMCFWSVGYHNNDTVTWEVVGADFFNENHGYTNRNDRNDIRNLSLGEEWENYDDRMSGRHWIIRIK